MKVRTRALGQSGIESSVLGLGTWAIGGWMWGQSDEKQAIAAIHASVDNGINLIDTAPGYGFGLSEEIIGRAIQGRRDRVVLASKCGLVCNGSGGKLFFRSNALGLDPQGHISVHCFLSPASVRSEVEASLRRLQTDYIDLYQTHWQDPTTPIAETMGELLKLKAEGKIRAIGVSNATSNQMHEYRKLGPIDSDQEKYSMLDRHIEKNQLPYCRKHKIALLAYSPLALGLLTGKIRSDRVFEPGDQRLTDSRFRPENLNRILAMLEQMKAVAERHQATMAQLVLAWTVHQPGLTHALCGARNAAQAEENAKAATIELSNEDLAQINAAIDSSR